MTTDTRTEEAIQATVSSTELILRDATALAIKSPEEYQQAGVRLREIVSRARDIDDERKNILRPFDEARKRIMNLFRPALENLAEAERVVKGSISKWSAEQDRLRRIEEARLQEAARKEAARLEARAQKAEVAGHYEKAAALAGAADSVTVPTVAEAPKATGISTRESWSANVVDPGALIAAVARGDVPEGAITINMTFLNQVARALKGGMHYPGVEAVCENIVVARAGLQNDSYMPRRERD